MVSVCDSQIGVGREVAYPAPPVVPLPYSVLPLYESVLPPVPRRVLSSPYESEPLDLLPYLASIST